MASDLGFGRRLFVFGVVGGQFHRKIHQVLAQSASADIQERFGEHGAVGFSKHLPYDVGIDLSVTIGLRRSSSWYSFEEI